MNKSFLDELKGAMSSNGGKIPYPFILEQVAKGTTVFFQLTPSMRVCVITLPTGHEVLGYAQVLDPANDVEALGNSVAKENAINELWKVFGSIAKVL